jgi:MFS family permease
MALLGGVLTPFSAELSQRLGPRRVIGTGFVAMAAGLAVIAVTASAQSVWALAVLMMLVGVAGPLVMPPVTAVLLNAVPPHQAGTASGVFNTSRQVGGALAVAVFGALLAGSGSFASGLRASLLIGAAVAIAAATTSRLVGPKWRRLARPRSVVMEEVAA